MTIPIKIISKEDYEKENLKPDQEVIWDSIANPWKIYVVKEIPLVVDFLKGKKGRVIDLGCGSGRNMVKGDFEYYGVDFSKVQLKHAWDYIQEEGINTELFKSNLNKLDKNIFEDEMFDYGLFIGALHCLESSEDRLNALREFYRILKVGGQGLVSVWNSEDVRFGGLKGEIYMSWRQDRVAYMRYYYLYSKDEFLDLLRKVGFKILEVYEPRKRDRFSKKNLVVRVGK